MDVASVTSDLMLGEESKLMEKLEKEKSKRRFCEAKIIELQKELIQLQESNYALKENCARKNLALKQVDQILATNKNELDKYRASKMSKINELLGKLDETQSALDQKSSSLEDEQKTTESLSANIEQFQFRIADLERELLRLGGENETFRAEIDQLKIENGALDENLKQANEVHTDKIANMKKQLDVERGKVARYEQEESNSGLRAQKLQQNCDMMKLQMEQGKVMRENLQKQLHSERVNWHKKLTELGDELKQAQQKTAESESRQTELNSELKIQETKVETTQRELATAQSEMELVKSRFSNEKDKLEVYFRSVQKSAKIEWEKAAELRVAEMRQMLEKRNAELENELTGSKRAAQEQLIALKRRLTEEYQAKIKVFLQQHYNQGLDALGISSHHHHRSSSPDISPIQSARQIEPRPPLEPRPSSTSNKRERELRKMISGLLAQPPKAELPLNPPPPPPQHTFLTSKLAELANDTSLTDHDKKSLQRLRQLMDEKF